MADYEAIHDGLRGRTFDIIYTTSQGQSLKQHGKLLSTNHDGFVVIEHYDEKRVLLPKDSVDSMIETGEL